MTEPLPPIPDLAAPLSIAISVDGCIAENKPCIDCGYNLRGLKTDGRCPECGSEVAASLRGHDLHRASLPWLRTVRHGFMLMKRSMLLVLLVFGVAMIGGIVWSSISPQPPPFSGLYEVVFAVLLVSAAAFALYGLIEATCVEPRIAQQESFWSSRRMVRVFAVATLGLWGALTLLAELGPRAPWMRQLAMCARLLLAILAISVAVAFVQHVIALLERTAEEKIIKETKQARQYIQLALVLAGVILVANALLPLLAGHKEVADRLRSTASAARGCGACINFIFVISSLQIIWRCAAIMDRTVKAAEENTEPDPYKGGRPLAPPLFRESPKSE